MEHRTMLRTTTLLTTILALFALTVSTPSPSRAESGAPDPDALFPTCGTFGAIPPACVDPNAKGTKVTGTLTIAYDGVQEGQDLNGTACTIFQINNQFLVLTVGFNNLIQPFNVDFTTTKPPTPGPICFEQSTQVQFVVDFITKEVIPALYQCTGASCPGWRFKSVNMLTTGGQSEGAVYAEIAIAVK
jgi:hypothetical protein